MRNFGEKYGADKSRFDCGSCMTLLPDTDYSLYDLHHIHGAEMAYSHFQRFYPFITMLSSLVQPRRKTFLPAHTNLPPDNILNRQISEKNDF